MVDVRNLVEQAVEAVTQRAANTADAGASAAAQGMQVTQAVASVLTQTLLGLPEKLRDLELPSAKQRLQDIADQLEKIGDRLHRLSQHLSQAGRHLGDPALQGSGKLIVDGIDAAVGGFGFLRLNPEGIIRFLPRSLSRPYLDGIGTIHVGLSAASDLTRLFVGSWPSISEGFKDIAEDLDRSASLLEATSNTLRELADLAPI